MTITRFLKKALSEREIHWREGASCAFIAAPVVGIVGLADGFTAPGPLSLFAASALTLLFWHRRIRPFLVPELIMGLLFPSAAAILFSVWFLALRKWKESRLARKSQEPRRSSLLAELGFLRTIAPTPLGWLPPTLVLAWTSEFVSHRWPALAPRLGTLLFALIATGLVSMLTSPPSQVKRHPSSGTT